MRKYLSKLLVICVLLGLVVWAMPCVQAEAASNVKLNKTKITLEKGDSKTITVKNKPSGAKVTFKSSNTKVAKVSSTGLVIAQKKGNATITVTVKTSTKTTKLKCKVKVKNPAKTNSGELKEPVVEWYKIVEKGGLRHFLFAVKNPNSVPIYCNYNVNSHMYSSYTESVERYFDCIAPGDTQISGYYSDITYDFGGTIDYQLVNYGKTTYTPVSITVTDKGRNSNDELVLKPSIKSDYSYAAVVAVYYKDDEFLTFSWIDYYGAKYDLIDGHDAPEMYDKVEIYAYAYKYTY